MRIPFKKGIMHLAESKADEDYLIGSRCRDCSAAAFPPRVVCHKCAGENVEEIPLSRRGELASFTVSWAAPEGFKPPVIMGFIDLPEGVRLLSLITGCEPDKDALPGGREMDLVFEGIRSDQEGNQVVAFMFRPAAAGGIS
jgi:uncharacterized OB-fold protein